LREAGVEPVIMSALVSESDDSDDQQNISHVLHLITYLSLDENKSVRM